MRNIWNLCFAATLTGSVLPATTFAATLATGAASTHYVVSLSGLDSANCDLIGIWNAAATTAIGHGTASGTWNIPDPICTQDSGVWQVEMPQRDAEGTAGLPLPLQPPRPGVDDIGTVAAWLLYAGFEFGTVSVAQPSVVTVTVDGTFSASGRTEPIETSTGVGALLNASAYSRAWLWIVTDDPSDLFHGYLWDLDIQCRTFVSNGGKAEGCSEALDYPFDQSIEVSLLPGYSYTFHLDLQEQFEVLARSMRVPEPGTLALFGLGLAGLVLTRRRKA